MSHSEVTLLKRALERQKKARKEAERILEQKSQELYSQVRYFKEQSERLENIVSEKTSELDGIFINIIDPYVVMDIMGNVIRTNPAARDFLGIDATKEAVNLMSLVHPEYMTYTMESFQRLYEVGSLKNYKAKIILPSSEEKFVQINSSLVYDKEGKPVAAQGIIRDITQENEIKKLLADQKNKLKASEKRLSTLVSNLHTGVLLEDENNNIALSNMMFSRMFQLQENTGTVGKNGTSHVEAGKKIFKHPALFTSRTEEILAKKELVLAEEFETLQGRILKRDYVPVFNDNEYKGHLWSYNDITAQKNYRSNLEIQKEKYSSIIANMNLGLVELDANDCIILANKSFCEMSGYEEGELIGKKVYDISIYKNEKAVSGQLAKRRKGISDSYEVEVTHKDGTTGFWLISGAPRYNEVGEIVGSIGVHLDVTNQKNLEFQKERLLEELETSNQGLQEYAHIVTHDLKSPLRSISALATWINEDYKDVLDENGIYNLTMMQEKVAAMDKLIDGILKYSTINSDSLEDTAVNINEVIREITEIIYIPEHVEVKVEGNLPILKVDKTKIHQLFQNFLSNAVVNIDKPKGTVRIACKETPEHWEFSVADNGVGIPEEYHQKIFKIFQSVGNNERSTGIGLSIVKKIIDLYDGKVWLESQMGVGTTFYFTIKKIR